MIDIDLFLVALLLGAAWTPWASVRRYLPQVDGDPEADQEKYERGYRRRLAFRALPLILLVWFFVRLLSAPESPEPPPGFTTVALGALFATFVLSAFGAALWRYRWDRAFIVRHPQFAGSLQPIGLRLMGPAMVMVAFALLGLALSSHDEIVSFGSIAASFVVLFGGQRLILAALVRSRVEVPLDSPFGCLVADTVARFGFTPKRAVLIPATVANAYALPDGTVMVTTALRVVATDEEIAAVLAHELSHARDRDVPRIRRSGLVVWLLTMLVAGLVGYGVAASASGETFLVPMVALAVAAFLSVAGLFRSTLLHRLEFKCDRAASEKGYGPDLARCLTKLHRYMGMPTRWVGIERRLMTHPSLYDRLAALEESSSRAHLLS